MQLSLEEFLNNLNQYNLIGKNSVSKPLKQLLVSEEKYNSYSDEIKNVYKHCFNEKENLIQLDKVVGLQKRNTKVPVCNKLLSSSLPVYKCYDCIIHEAGILCQSCFENGNHSGHRFKKVLSGGGNCDCGNPLALKKQGFCIDHTGTLEIPQIPEAEYQKIKNILCILLEWFFVLRSKQQECKDSYGIALFQYLKRLNTNSIYYNVITSQLLTSKQKNGNNFLSWLFKVKSKTICSSINDLFFTMFNLDEFKIALADSFLKAYNTTQSFQITPFHSLYIQLFANDHIVLKVAEEFKNTIFITKPKFDLERYLNDIAFISSINEKPANAFYKIYFQKNRYVPLTFMNEIQELAEKSHSMHEVDVVTNNINSENQFYSLYSQIISKVKNNQQLLIDITKGVYEALISKKYSYKNNVAILPYQRVFSVCLFTLFKGDMTSMTIQSVSQKLNINKEQVVTIFKIISQQVIRCLLAFAYTYHRRSYFDNYIILYVRKGVKTIKYDQLLLKESAHILGSAGTGFSNIILKLFEQNQQMISTNSKQYLTELLKSWIILFSLLVEICVTETAQILVEEDLELNNKRLIESKVELCKSIINLIGPITREQIRVLENYFIGEIKDQFLLQHLHFNKSTKKYENAQKSSSQNPFIYEYYTSKKRSGQQIIKEDLKENVINLMRQKKQLISKKLTAPIQKFISVELLEKISNLITEKQSFLDEAEKQNICLQFLCTISKITPFVQKSFYESAKHMVQKLVLFKSIRKQSQDEAELLRQELLKKRLEEKKAKFQKKQNKALNFFSAGMQQEEQENKQDVSCLICRAQMSQFMEGEGQSMCYFSCAKLKRFISCSGIDQQLGIAYSSCFHAAHESCFAVASQNRVLIDCPLCKTLSNGLLMAGHDYESVTFPHIIGNTQKLIKWLQKLYLNQQITQNKMSLTPFSIFKSMVSCMIEYIGFVGLFNKPLFEHKFVRICKQLKNHLQLLWTAYKAEQKDQLLQIMQQKIKSLQSQNNPSNFIKCCILSLIMNNVQKLKMSTESIDKLYGNKINKTDLQKLKQNISLVFDLQIKEDSHNTMVQQKQEIPQLQFPYKFFSPPQTIKEMMVKRDNLAVNCKTGHNLLACCFCQQIVCFQCKTYKSHCTLHGVDSMFFSFLTGELWICGFKKTVVNCLYENKAGLSWNSDKQPQGFELNQELYDQLCKSASYHTMQDFLRSKIPKMFGESILELNFNTAH